MTVLPFFRRRTGAPPGAHGGGVRATAVAPRHKPGEAGFTLIEVLASALVVVLLAVGTLAALDAITRESFQTRLRTDAQALAEQDEAHLRDMTIDQLANLSTTLPAVSLDGVQFSVKEQATFVSDSSQSASCSSPSTDYLETKSTITWTNMGADSPVVETGVDTPPISETSSGQGGLAVSTGVSGTTVSITGPSGGSSSTTTLTADSTGCALFGDLTPGTYTVNAYSYGPTLVDTSTGQTVTTGTPDSTTSSVVGGSVVSASLPLALPGSVAYHFVSTSGNPTGVAAGAVSVLASNNTLGGNHLLICTLSDTTCPAVNNADTSFAAADWPQVAGVTSITDPVVPPLTSAYTTYAGMCANNEPAYGSNGGTDVTTTVTAGAASNVTVTVPAIVIHVFTGTSSSPGSEVMPTHLYVKDSGCNVRYAGYVLGQTAPTVSSGQSPEQAVVPLRSTYPATTTGGVLAYPAMPYGTYSVCVDNGTSFWSATSKVNGNSGLTVNLYEGATGTAIATELSTC